MGGARRGPGWRGVRRVWELGAAWSFPGWLLPFEDNVGCVDLSGGWEKTVYSYSGCE